MFLFLRHVNIWEYCAWNFFQCTAGQCSLNTNNTDRHRIVNCLKKLLGRENLRYSSWIRSPGIQDTLTQWSVANPIPIPFGSYFLNRALSSFYLHFIHTFKCRGGNPRLDSHIWKDVKIFKTNNNAEYYIFIYF